MSISLISHPDCGLFDNGAYHPECPARLDAIHDQLVASGLELVLQHYQAPAVLREQLYRVHEKSYIDGLFSEVERDGRVWIDSDTTVSREFMTAAVYAAGAVIMGVDQVMNDQHRAVFCNIRPPGHHAEHDRAMGFCVFNNIAVGAAYALEHYGLERVAIFDFDVHRGNGTEDIFRTDPRLLLCSTFQHPFYPHCEQLAEAEHIINMPLAAGSGGKEFRDSVSNLCLPRLKQFQPQLILISAGFDAHIEDEMSDLRLVEQDYAWVTEQLRLIADEYCQGHIVSVLEGGYALSALGRSVVAHIKALIG